MNKKNHTLPKNQSGSALVVTIMLTSVMLILAIVVLQRIIPYSRQVRDMQDSTQSYYAAVSHSEIALHEVANGITSAIVPGAAGNISLTMPTFSPIAGVPASTIGTFTALDRDSKLPIQIKLYPTDAPALFGTSRKDPAKHTLSPLGGITFDMTGVNTQVIGFNLTFIGEAPVHLGVEFSYQTNTIADTFFGDIQSTISSINLLSASDGATIPTQLNTFLSTHDCSLDTVKNCSLTLTLKDSAQPIDFTLSTTTSNITLSDLNTIIVADGFSDNGEYHNRIVEIKQKNQGI